MTRALKFAAYSQLNKFMNKVGSNATSLAGKAIISNGGKMIGDIFNTIGNKLSGAADYVIDKLPMVNQEKKEELKKKKKNITDNIKKSVNSAANSLVAKSDEMFGANNTLSKNISDFARTANGEKMVYDRVQDDSLALQPIIGNYGYQPYLKNLGGTSFRRRKTGSRSNFKRIAIRTRGRKL